MVKKPSDSLYGMPPTEGGAGSNNVPDPPKDGEAFRQENRASLCQEIDETFHLGPCLHGPSFMDRRSWTVDRDRQDFPQPVPISSLKSAWGIPRKRGKP